MNTREDPDFGEIPEYIAERLQSAEARFREMRGDRNPLVHLKLLAQGNIFGTEFFVYDARGLDVVTPGVEDAEPVPILALYATQSRLMGLCDLAARRWVSEGPEFVETLQSVEALSAEATDPLPPDLEAQLESFGIQVSRDSYILGYRDARSPLVVRKELILDLLALLAAGLTALGDPRGAHMSAVLGHSAFELAVKRSKMD